MNLTLKLVSATSAVAMAITTLVTANPSLAANKAPGRGEKYAQCLIAHVPDFVERGLLQVWPSDRFVPYLPREFWNVCKRDAINPDKPELRYLLAWGILQRDHLAEATLDFSSLPPLPTEAPPLEGTAAVAAVPTDRIAEFQAALKSKRQRERILPVVGECVVRTRTADTRAVLMDPEDPARLDVLVPALQACTPPNTQISFTRDTLKGLLAWTFVRLAITAKKSSFFEQQ